MAEDITPEELANALSDLAPKLAEEALVVNDAELQNIVKKIAPNVKAIESTLKEGVSFKSASFAAVFQPLVNILTKPIFDIRKGLKDGLNTLTNKITQPFKDVRDFLNKPIFNIKDAFKNAFGGIRKLFTGFRSKEEREEAEARNPAKFIIKYLKKNIEPLLKRIAVFRGEAGDGIFKKLLSFLSGPALLGGLKAVGVGLAGLTTALGAAALGKTIFDNIIAPAMDRMFEKNIQMMNRMTRQDKRDITDNQGNALYIDENNRITTNPEGARPIRKERLTGLSPLADVPLVPGAIVAPPLGEVAKSMGLESIFGQITALRGIEGRIIDAALNDQTILFKNLVSDYRKRVNSIENNSRIKDALGGRFKPLIESIKNTAFFKTLNKSVVTGGPEGGISFTVSPSDITREDAGTGVTSVGQFQEVIARRRNLQLAANEAAGTGLASLAPPVAMSVVNSVTQPSENYFQSGLTPESTPIERLFLQPSEVGALIGP